MRSDDKIMGAGRISAISTGGAAAIHFAVAGEHFREWWLYGAFFLLLTVVQGVLALRTWVTPTSRLVLVTAGVNLATVGLWVLTRTIGLPFGPEPGTPEAWGVTDGVCAGLEVLATLAGAATLYWLHREAPSKVVDWTPTRAVGVVVAAAAALVMVASGVAVAAPGESGHDAADDSGAMAHADGGHATGGASAMGNGERHEMANLPDVSGATSAQTAAARDLVTTLETQTAKYRDPAVAQRAGYDVPAALQRWSRKHDGKPAARVAALHVPRKQARQDDRLLDPAAPETLIYHRTQDGSLTLIGVMFTAEGQQPPASYAPYLRWHFHHTCVGPDGQRSEPAGDGESAPCPTGTAARTSGYMTHVWFVDPGQRAEQVRYAFAMTPPNQQLKAAQRADA